ncbi:MAG: hypothetical protein U0T81_01145 [Saprospiraceae bacterium]
MLRIRPENSITGIDQSGCQIQDRVRVLVRIIKEVWWPTVINPGSGVVDNKFFSKQACKEYQDPADL